MKTTKRCSKCENYLTATTNRSRNLIHVRSTPHSPMLEVRSRNPIQGPAMSFGDGGDQREAAAATEKMEIKIKRTGFNEKLQTRGPNAACKSFRRSRASSIRPRWRAIVRGPGQAAGNSFTFRVLTIRGNYWDCFRARAGKGV